LIECYHVFRTWWWCLSMFNSNQIHLKWLT
jgi:hypothetical protein